MTTTAERTELMDIKKMAKKAADRARQERGVRVVGASTVIATYNGHEEASNREKKHISRFFQSSTKENQE